MQLKKKYKTTTLFFEVIGRKMTLEKEDIIEDIIDSLNGFKFINKNLPFNELIKLQQKNPAFILVNFESEIFDEMKFFINVIYNFLVETKQSNHFMIDHVELMVDNNCYIIFATECLQKPISSDMAFSPIIRSCWRNSVLIDNIFRKHY